VRACLMGGGVQPAPSYSARYTNGAALAAGAPIRSRTLRPAILIDREHGRTLLVSDDRPSGAPAQKSEQHQDYTGNSHNVLLLSFAAVICWKHAITLVCPAPRKMRDMRRELTYDRERSPH
jgi:hypothetical protein